MPFLSVFGGRAGHYIGVTGSIFSRGVAARDMKRLDVVERTFPRGGSNTCPGGDAGEANARLPKLCN